MENQDGGKGGDRRWMV